MIPGFSGHLISEFYLESRLARADACAVAPVDHSLERWMKRSQGCGPATSVRSIFEAAATPLLEALGFEVTNSVEPIEERLVGTVVRTGADTIALIVAPWAEPLDQLWRTAVTFAIRRRCRWTLLCNGTHLRIVDGTRLYARRHIQFDLEVVADDSRTRAALSWIARADRFRADRRDGSCLDAIVSDSERHATGVCRSLKDGVLAASSEVLAALVPRSERAGNNDSFEQALTIVYRLLFLLFAEARGLVPLWHPIYRESYSIEALRGIAEQEAAVGLWDTLRAIARLAHSGCHAGDLRVTPFNGRLFAPSRTPLADKRNLNDESARRALLALSTRPAVDRAGRERIAYRDLGVEQLGAVYETLLDYEPRAGGTGLTLEAGSGLRKSTGSYYTPQPIAEYLVRHTLGPLVREASPDRILGLRVVDPAMGSGAFLVAACRYLAAAYETALVRAGGYAVSDFGEAERASIRRTIAERCLYGVDLNPMAVQLARLSIWLATLAADRPLTFLDHHLQSGDSLVGVWLALLRDRPCAGGGRGQRMSNLPLFPDLAIEPVLRDVLPVRFQLESIPDDTIDQVRAKERALAAISRRDSALSKWKRIANLWCATWFATNGRGVPPTAFASLMDSVLTGEGSLPVTAADEYIRRADAAASERKFFHWELEFPEAFFGADGGRLPAPGFDVVIGNPPWEMMRADVGVTDQRSRAREKIAPLLRFTRESGMYGARSDGHANRYQLFLERAMALTRPGGRLGLVLPSGFATDHGSARLRRLLMNTCDVDTLVGFDNRGGVFPIHRSVRFLLLTATAGQSTKEFACRLGEHDTAILDRLDEDVSPATPTMRLSPALLERLSGPDLTIPELRTATDLAIVERAASLFPPLGSERGWNAHFGRELNATDDREYFHAPGSGLPIVEGKQLQPFRTRLSAARRAIAVADAKRLVGPGRIDRPRLAYRDVASATNRLTLIAAILPAGCVSTHTVFCLRTPMPLREQHFLCGLFNSFVVNYLVRLRVTTHVTTATIERLPIPRREDSPGAFREIAARARVLSHRDDRSSAVRLQVLVARLYQLTVAELQHVLGTFPLVAQEERDAVLAGYVAETQR